MELTPSCCQVVEVSSSEAEQEYSSSQRCREPDTFDDPGGTVELTSEDSKLPQKDPECQEEEEEVPTAPEVGIQQDCRDIAELSGVRYSCGHAPEEVGLDKFGQDLRG